MKRIFAIVLAAVMLLALCACGGVTEEEARAIELYNKYADVIDRLENEDYTGVIQEVAGLINSSKEPEDKTPMTELMAGEWYLASGEDKLNPAETLSAGADGTVTVGGKAYTWLDRNSGDDYISGYLLDNGVHTYVMEVCKYKDDMVPYAQLWTVEANGDSFHSDDWVGTYYNDAMLGYLLLSWRNLDDYDEVMDDYIGVQRSYAGVNDEELDWSVISSGEGTITADLGGAYTLTVELRGDKPIAFLTENATGNQAAYYASYEEYGYDYSWPEYIYPEAMGYLNECVEDLTNNYTPSFGDYTVEVAEGESRPYYEGNAAWKRLHEIFVSLGDYKDSAELAGRFTILKDMYVGASMLSVDNMGNESNSREYEVIKYNSLGQMISGKSYDIRRMYGGDNWTKYFTYDESGRITQFQQGTGNSVEWIVTPFYDNQGRMAGGEYKSNSYTHEVSYVYDAQGRLSQNTVWYSSDRYQYTYTYDAAGSLLKVVCWYGWGEDYNNYRYTTDYTYDAQGHLTKRVETRENYNDYRDTFTLSKTITWVYTNDAQGRPVSAEYSEVNSDGSSTYASQTITYNYDDLYFFE